MNIPEELVKIVERQIFDGKHPIYTNGILIKIRDEMTAFLEAQDFHIGRFRRGPKPEGGGRIGDEKGEEQERKEE